MVSFDTISNLYDAKGIAECYQGEASAPIPGIKDANGDWNTTGHPDRIIHVTQRELEVFAKLFDGNDKWQQARLPQLHVEQLLEVLIRFSKQNKVIGDMQLSIFNTRMWEETGSQKDGAISRYVHFPDSTVDAIISGPHIGVSNPLFKSSRSICKLNSDYDNIDLTNISSNYIQRVNYTPFCSIDDYFLREPKTYWDTSYHEEYRLVMRRMLNQGGERTLISALLPPGMGHIHTIFGLAVSDKNIISLLAATFSSIPFDFYVKSTGKSDILFDLASKLPLLNESIFALSMSERSLLLNCVTNHYANLWKTCFDTSFTHSTWSKSDPRLSPTRFTSLTPEWTWDTPLRTDYERRQALVEIDVLTAMALGMTLQQLKTIYRIQFPVLQSYEADTWYDANGRITFTNNRSLTGVGFTRPEWENAGAVQPIKRGDAPWDGIMKHAPAGYVFARTITDDTMPGGPVQHTIEYAAPFDRCDREQDYETAWKFFEEKYKE